MDRTVELESRALALVEDARALTITTPAQYEAACQFLLTIKAFRQELDRTFDETIKKAYDAHKAAVAAKKRHEEPMAQAEAIVKPKIGIYLAEEERKRREVERKAQEEAQLAAAELAESEGALDQVDGILNGAVSVPPVIVPTAAPKVNGISFRQTWKFRITDLSQIPREYLMPDLVKIGGVVRALKGSTKIPGVTVYADDTVAAGVR